MAWMGMTHSLVSVAVISEKHQYYTNDKLWSTLVPVHQSIIFFQKILKIPGKHLPAQCQE